MPVVADVVADLSGRRIVSELPDEPFYAASTMKVPVLIELFRRHDEGTLDLDQPVTIRTTFSSIVDGSPYVMEPDEVDDAFADADGQQRTVRQLIERMIVVSSNEATNLLIGLLDISRIQAALKDIGVTRMVVARPIGDYVARDAGLDNVITAADLVRVMTAVANGTAASSQSCAQMLAVLGRQHYIDGIGGGLPAGTRLASKSGWMSTVRHDVALVWPPGRPPYCQAVCTSGFGERVNGTREINRRAAAAYARMLT